MSVKKTEFEFRIKNFKDITVEVSIIPDTGNIIQVNPVHLRKKVQKWKWLGSKI